MPLKQRLATPKGKTALIVGIVITGAVVIAAAAGGYAYYAATLAGMEVPTATQFSVNIRDGMVHVDITEDIDCGGVLYETNDLNDPVDFTVLVSYSGEFNMTPTDWENKTKAFMVLQLNGTVEHDDDLFGEANDVGNRTYGNRQFVISANTANTLVMYVTPSAAGIVVMDTADLSVVDFDGGDEIETDQNVTILIGINGSETWAAYVAYFDFLNGANVPVVIQVTFNATVALGDFNIQGATKRRQSTTILCFDVTSGRLDSSVQELRASWGAAAADIAITGMDLLFGETSIT